MSAALIVEIVFAIAAAAIALASIVISRRAERRLDRVEAKRRELEAAKRRRGAGS